MTREELKERCKKQIEMCEILAIRKGEDPHGKIYEEYKLILELLEQEPKTGHWMKSNIGGAKVCSVCNAHMGLSSFKFCPNCGAKMVEPRESEDKENKDGSNNN